MSATLQQRTPVGSLRNESARLVSYESISHDTVSMDLGRSACSHLRRQVGLLRGTSTAVATMQQEVNGKECDYQPESQVVSLGESSAAGRSRGRNRITEQQISCRVQRRV
jgi:hypothetical protein